MLILISINVRVNVLEFLQNEYNSLGTDKDNLRDNNKTREEEQLLYLPMVNTPLEPTPAVFATAVLLQDFQSND